ncbi:MAG TPA: aminodeoxychorismate/anthranilate synthase component II [Actinomycetota bacterium]|nr:aminodeoxychorismate/anthranilate synthase component II [Actinomycetota bacterium]
MKLLVIDNYDSFVYNLAQAFGTLGASPVVLRNDVPLEEAEATEPDALVVSPGPGAPEDAGISVAAIKRFAPRVPVLGVCLGHQCIAVAFGGRVERASVGPRHGKTSVVEHDGRGVFTEVVNPFTATRYHSLALDETLPSPDLEITARSTDGTVMGIRHRELPVEGVQFHPESVLTRDGPQMLANFLKSIRR